MESALDRALATERDYFELGAKVRRLNGATLAWMPELSASPAAAVVHRVEPSAIDKGWIETVEQALAGIGARLARIYLDRTDERAPRLLREAGYSRRREIVFASALSGTGLDLAILPIEREEDWARKLALHNAAGDSPDGHPTAAADLVAVERTKAAHGLDCFLAERGGDVVGAACAVRGEGVLRFKNLVVHPAFRRGAVGSRLLALLAEHGRRHGLEEQCAFAVEGGAGERLYRALGMSEVGSQVEWSRSMSPVSGTNDADRC